MTETAPTTANRTLRRLPNAAYRPREYLTDKEVERLIEATRKRGRNGARDAAAILLAYKPRRRFHRTGACIERCHCIGHRVGVETSEDEVTTGVASIVEGVNAKLVELANDAVPGLMRVGLLVNPAGANRALVEGRHRAVEAL